MSPVEDIRRRCIKCYGSWCRDCHYHPRRNIVGAFFRLEFKASNNKAEYETLLTELRTVLGMGTRDVEIYSDSQLVVYQVYGSFEVLDSQMKEYLQVVK